MAQAARKRLVPRCRFRSPETGRRCVEPGLGQPPYCLPHLSLVRSGEAEEDPLYEAFETVLNHPRMGDILGRVADFIDFASRRGLDRTPPPPEESPHYRGPDRGFYSEHPPSAQGGHQHQADPRQQTRRPPPRPGRPQEDPRSVLGIPPGVPLTASLVKKHQRALATIHHPDSGGTTAAMQRINSAAAALLAQCS
jgi:hypothetical protein